MTVHQLFPDDPGSNAGQRMASYQTGAYTKETWLTPPAILRALGPFDLDPCACPDPRPWPTAAAHYAQPDDNGLALPWFGRVWLNPPYGNQAGRWLARLADHGSGVALVFARTDTAAFQAHVLGKATAVLFLAGRVTFYGQDGQPARYNAAAPSCLAAYSLADAQALRDSGLAGRVVDLL
jgi:hypothetical protein